MYTGLNVKCQFFLTDFLTKLEFSRQILKNTHISSFIKIRPVGSELFHVNGRTDIKKPIVVFRNYANAPKNLLAVRLYTAY